MIIRRLSVTANVNIGALSEKRIRLFSELVQEAFPIKSLNVPQGFASIRQNATGSNIMLTPQQIGITQVSTSPLQKAEVNIDEIQEWLTKIFEADFLALDEKAQFVFDIEAIEKEEFHVGNRTKQAMEVSDSKITGLGVRVMIETENLQGDYRVEPFLPDPFYSFFQLQAVTKNPIDVHIIGQRTNAVLDMFSTEFKSYSNIVLQKSER